MPTFYLNSLLICLLFILAPVTGNAFWDRWVDAETIVTMRNGNPCISYPQDDEVRRKPYAFSSLAVTTAIGGKSGWVVRIASPYREGLLEPNTPVTCVEYGVLNPGMVAIEAADPLLLDTPYRAHIHLTEAPGVGVSYKRDFESDFCLTRNEKGEPIIVSTLWEDNDLRCLKPGESPKQGFWQWLFGK